MATGEVITPSSLPHCRANSTERASDWLGASHMSPRSQSAVAAQAGYVATRACQGDYPLQREVWAGEGRCTARCLFLQHYPCSWGVGLGFRKGCKSLEEATSEGQRGRRRGSEQQAQRVALSDTKASFSCTPSSLWLGGGGGLLGFSLLSRIHQVCCACPSE